MMSTEHETPHALAPFWGVHCEKDGQPMLRDWATSKAAAEEKMAALKQADDDDGVEYWVIQMSVAEADSFREAGVIPKDA